MSKADDQPITRKELREDLESFGIRLASTLTTAIVSQIRRELKEAIAESEQRMMDYADQLAAEQSLEIMDAVADMIQPLQKKSANHERRITRLEHGLA